MTGPLSESLLRPLFTILTAKHNSDSTTQPVPLPLLLGVGVKADPEY